MYEKHFQRLSTFLEQEVKMKKLIDNSENDKNPKLLFDAVKSGNLETVDQLLKNGANVNCVSLLHGGYIPLHFAVDNGDSDVIKFLLDNGARVNAKEPCFGCTPLHLAVENGNEEVIALLLEKRADVNAKNRNNETSLHIAARSANISIAEILLNHGANIHDFTLRGGYTPLHFASDLGDLEGIKLYLNKGADINIASAKDNLTPLHIATKKRHLKVVSLLLQQSALVDEQDNYGKTVLNYAVEKRDLKTVEAFLKNSLDINNKSHRKSLETAANDSGKESKKIMKALLDYGFIVNPETANNSEFLHKTVEKGYLKIVEDLLKHGANVNMLHCPKYDGRDFTPLHTAVKHKQGEVAKLLIRYNADINAKDKYGKTPMFYAIENEDLKMTQILLSGGANVKNDCQLLHFAAQNQMIEIVKTLLEYIDVNASDSYGKTALHYTLFKPNNNHRLGCDEVDIDIKTEIVKLLLTKGANVNAQTKNGVTTLHIAAERGLQKIVEVLLEKNANVNLGEKNDITPLHLSAKFGHIQITKMLLSKGANVNDKTKDGTTTLLIAAEERYGDDIISGDFEDYLQMETDLIPTIESPYKGWYFDVVNTVLESGANPNCRDKKCRTPLHIAARKGYQHFIKPLLKYGADLNLTCSKNYTPLYYAEKRLRVPYNIYNNADVDRTVVQLKLHIIKMKSASLYLHESNLRSVQNFNEDYKNKCEEEIARMKSHKLENTKISFYDILVKDLSSLAKCMKNEDIVKAMEAETFKKLFPTYADMISLQFREAMKRKELLSQSNTNTICHMLLPELAYDCIEKIVTYLNNEDLRTVIEACKPA